MTNGIKGVIFSIENVLVQQGTPDPQIINEIIRLVNFLKSRNITPIVLANHDWTVSKNGQKQKLETVLAQEWGDVQWFVAQRYDGTPFKPKPEAVRYVLDTMGWDVTEAVYIGNKDTDMQTAVNGNVLFLNVSWYSEGTDYGLKFSSPFEVARFIDTCLIREHLWYCTINSSELEYYALAPYSTWYPEYTVYSTDAKQTAKWGAGHPDFWTKYFLATIYLSGLHQRVSYITSYPGHVAGSGNIIMEEPMLAFTKCFRKTYLRDLICRHATATKSATARATGARHLVNHLNQLNTIYLERSPLKGTGTDRYKNPPLTHKKTVLVIDDICTNGYSMEAARAFIQQTNAKVICVSWLKTVNSNYEQLKNVKTFSPYVVQTFDRTCVHDVQQHTFSSSIVDQDAATELDNKLRSYIHWQWPNGI